MDFLNKIFSQPKLKDFYDFFIRFYAYISTGTDLITSLYEIAKYTKNKELKKSLLNITRYLDDGNSLADSFEKEKIFPKDMVATIRAGDESGTLETSVDAIKKSLKQEKKIYSKVRYVYYYAIFSIIGLTFALTVISAFIIPQYQQLYAKKKIALPFITQLVFSISDFINHYWYLIVILMVGIGIGFMIFKRNNPEVIDEIKMNLPLYKKLNYLIMQYKFSSTLITLINAGVPITLAIESVGQVLNDRNYKNLCINTVRNISNGNDFGTALRESDRNNKFDPMIKNFIASGESTGTIPETLSEASVYFQEEIMEESEVFSLKFLGSFILPMAIIIAVLFLAMMYPYYTYFSALRGGMR